MSNIPSVRTIETRLSVSRETAKCIRSIMEQCNGELTRRVYHALQEIDGLLGTHGVESIQGQSMAWDDAVSYCNAGDPYKATVLFDEQYQRFSVGCWGDLVERNPQRFGGQE